MSSVDTRDVERVARRLRALGLRLSDLPEADRAVSQLVTAAAKQRAPRRTGRLAASLRASRAKGKAAVSSNLPYAPVIEYGWPARHITARPFLTPAADATRGQWIGIYDRELERVADATVT